MDRRRSPGRMDDRRHPGSGAPYEPERNRRRSRSPGHRYSPPPQSKRFRRDDDYQDDRHGRYHGDRSREPMTFRDFMGKLRHDVTPDDAKIQYERYLADFWGNQEKAEFEQQKNNPDIRRLYDPREVEHYVQKRDAASRAAATRFAEGAASDASTCPPGPAPLDEEGNPIAVQTPAAIDGDGTGGGSGNPKASQVVWQDDVIAGDLVLARRLVRVVDRERGITVNNLVQPIEVTITAPDGDQAAEEKKEDGDTAAAATNDGDTTTTKDKDADAKLPALRAEKESIIEKEEEQSDNALTLEGRIALLDDILSYLWFVHGIDYYGGRDYSKPEEEATRGNARLTVRPIKEEKVMNGVADGDAAANEKDKNSSGGGSDCDGHENDKDKDKDNTKEVVDDGAQDKQQDNDKKEKEQQQQQQQHGDDAKQSSFVASKEQRDRRTYEDTVLKTWRIRVHRGDPLFHRIQHSRLERQMEQFIDSQIVKHTDTKWGNKLSQKLFLAREFVVKHIKNKHGHVLEAEKERILDDIYYQNFKYAKEESHRRHGYGHGGGSFHGGRGRGGRGGGRGRGGVGGNMMGGMMMMSGPILVPGPGGMAPMIMMPMGGGGGRGGRGGGRGGRGGGGRGGFGAPMIMTAAGPGQYVDLDAPKNNRAVLDYGDL